MFDHRANRLLLRNRLLTVIDINVDLIKFPNRPFDPPPVDPPKAWIEELYMSNVDTKQASNMTLVEGFCHYDVRYPIGRGTGVSDELAKAISEMFEPGLDLQGPTHNLHIVATTRPPGAPFTNDTTQAGAVWYNTPVRIEWRGFATVST